MEREQKVRLVRQLLLDQYWQGLVNSDTAERAIKIEYFTEKVLIRRRFEESLTYETTS